MLNSRYTLLIPLSAALAASLGAQDASCNEGPGAQFGVEGYQCANCGLRLHGNRPITYTFFAEPVVTQAGNGSKVTAGDVIVAVDGSPITTQAGADRFAYPSAGAHMLTVRRGRDRKDFPVDVSSACGTAGARVSGGSGGYSYRVGAGAGAGGSGGTGVATGGTGVGRGVAGASVEPYTGPATGKFGFAVECRPSCKFTVAPDGQELYKYDGYPVVRALRAGSAAVRAGLQLGDEIISVEGKSILDEAGILQRAEQQDLIHLVMRRDGKDINVVMVVTK